MANVYLRRSSYDSPTLRQDVFDLLSKVDKGSTGPGRRVIIKPNLLTEARPDQAITTHPLIVRAAVEYALEQGSKVQVSDSNAVGVFDKVVAGTGLKEALSGLPVKVKSLSDSTTVSTGGRFGTIELSRDVLEADAIINLPKLKTHCQMGMTLAVKNLFGCVVGMRKPEWHFRVGENKEMFAELLATIYTTLRPSINLLDGILAMEGEGPGTGGTPRQVGILMASSEAHKVDMAVCRMVGLPEDWLLTTRAALAFGMDSSLEFEGELPEVRDFIIPSVRDLVFGPKITKSFMRRHMTSRPVNIDESCRYCAECSKICPARAITIRGKKLDFDYEACIRCYCCLEVCPHKAMRKHDTALKKVLEAVLRTVTRAPK